MVSLIPSPKSWCYHFMDNVCLNKQESNGAHIISISNHEQSFAIICIHVSGIQFPRSVIAARKPIPCRYRRLLGCPSEVEISADHAFVASWQAWHEAQVTHLEIKSCFKKGPEISSDLYIYIWISAIKFWHGLTGTYWYHSIVGHLECHWGSQFIMTSQSLDLGTANSSELPMND